MRESVESALSIGHAPQDAVNDQRSDESSQPEIRHRGDLTDRVSLPVVESPQFFGDACIHLPSHSASVTERSVIANGELKRAWRCQF